MRLFKKKPKHEAPCLTYNQVCLLYLLVRDNERIVKERIDNFNVDDMTIKDSFTAHGLLLQEKRLKEVEKALSDVISTLNGGNLYARK